MFAVTLRVLAAVVAVAAATEAAVGNTPFTAGSDKDPRCHAPAIMNCNSSLYPIMDYAMAGWFYHAPFKSCRPLYTAGGVHNCATNRDLPLTKTECEDICGEKCTLGNGSQGICMMEDYCKPVGEKATANPRPCGAYNVKCCPPHAAPAKAAAKPATPAHREEPEPNINFAPNKRPDSRQQRPRYEYVTKATRN